IRPESVACLLDRRDADADHDRGRRCSTLHGRHAERFHECESRRPSFLSRVLHPGPGVCGRDRRRGVDIPAPSRSRPLKRALPPASFVVTPYLFNYDMIAFSRVIIKLMDRGDNNASDYGLMLAVWAVPFLTVPLGVAGIPISCLPILMLGGGLIWRLWISAEPQSDAIRVPQIALESANR